jgi:hypothetical protein
MPNGFFQPGNVPDANYTMVRDRPIFAYNKQLVEEMWREYAPACPDSHFLEDAKSHFHSRTWVLLRRSRPRLRSRVGAWSEPSPRERGPKER